MALIDIYIPRMLGTVQRNTIIESFNRSHIGSIVSLDMHYKVNENSNAYYFAFIKLNLYNTSVASRLQSCLDRGEIAKLIYDEEAMQYWEIKKHIPRTMRHTLSNTVKELKNKLSTAIQPTPARSVNAQIWPRASVRTNVQKTAPTVSKPIFHSEVDLIPEEYSIWKGFPTILAMTSTLAAASNLYNDENDFNSLSQSIDKFSMEQQYTDMYV